MISACCLLTMKHKPFSMTKDQRDHLYLLPWTKAATYLLPRTKGATYLLPRTKGATYLLPWTKGATYLLPRTKGGNYSLPWAKGTTYYLLPCCKGTTYYHGAKGPLGGFLFITMEQNTRMLTPAELTKTIQKCVAKAKCSGILMFYWSLNCLILHVEIIVFTIA